MKKYSYSCIAILVLVLCSYSCTDEPVSESNPIILDAEIGLEGFSRGMVLDELIKLEPIVGVNPSDIANIEIKFNNETLISSDLSSEIDFEFNPEDYPTGDALFRIVVTDTNQAVKTLDIPVSIQRRLITLNIPENTINSAIIFPVVFVSRTDGSLIAWKEILRDERQITLSTADEFDRTTEFMVSFYLQDNGGISGIHTYQNLTRNNPVEVTFKERFRGIDTPGLGTRIPTVNFLSNDFVIGTNGGDLGLLNSLKDVSAGYNVYLNTSEDYLNVSRYVTPENPQPFNSLYLYNGRSYDYLFINFPLAEDFVLDKADFSNENLESHELMVSSPNISSNTYAHLSVFGATSPEEDQNNRFHGIYHFNNFASLDTPMQYDLNNSFYSYRHALIFSNYYTERKGPPINNYQIPDVTVDYTFANNTIDLSVAGTEHIVGKVECIDFDNLTYVWNITFKSKDNEKIIIPVLPESISHESKNAHESNTIKVEKVELLSYQSITTYDDYLQNVFKDQKDILDVTDWYQLVFSSRTGDFNRPIGDVIFQ